MNVDSLGDWISWIKYLSCVRYALNVSLSVCLRDSVAKCQKSIFSSLKQNIWSTLHCVLLALRNIQLYVPVIWMWLQTLLINEIEDLTFTDSTTNMAWVYNLPIVWHENPGIPILLVSYLCMKSLVWVPYRCSCSSKKHCILQLRGTVDHGLWPSYF